MNVWTSERIAQARLTLAKWHGTPHRDRVAVPGVGIDCVMLLVEVLADCGIVERVQLPAYSTVAGLHEPSGTLAKLVESVLYVEPVSIDVTRFGDIGIGQTGKNSAHIVFFDDVRIWHSLARIGVTHSKKNVWQSNIASVYRLTETGYKSLNFTI